MTEYKFSKTVRADDAARESFCALARETFRIDFAPWHAEGYWGDAYVPYTLFDGARAVSNVSANMMYFRWDGRATRLVQLGTVMTDPEYRGRGLAGSLMERVIADCAGCRGMYLYANDSARGFYEKYGFRAARECEYYVDAAPAGAGEVGAVKLPLGTAQERRAFADIITPLVPAGDPAQLNGAGLAMFYLGSFMGDLAYSASGGYAVAERTESGAELHAVWTSGGADLAAVIESLGLSGEVRLGFDPGDRSGFSCRELCREDTTLMVRGEIFDGFDERMTRFPALSQA